MRALIILLFAAPLAAQTVSLPATAIGDVDTKIAISATTDGANITWLLPDKGLTLIDGSEFGGDSKQARVFSCKPGVYRVWALSAKANIISPVAECVVTIGGVAPPPPPPPPPDTSVKVPDVVGKSFADASAALKAVGLAVLTIGDRAGVVSSQAPLAGSSTTAGSAVTLLMAMAPAKPKPPAKPPPRVGEKTDEFRPQGPPDMAWGPGVPFPAGMERFTRDGWTQLLHVSATGEPLASKVSVDRLPEQFRVSGGMEGLTGWRSTKYRLFPAPPTDGVAMIALAGGVKLPGLVRTYSEATRFDDVLSNVKSGKVFEHRSRVLTGERWTNAVLFRDAKEAPDGYNELGLKVCAACHKHPGTGEAGKPLVQGGSFVFSDALAWGLLRK